MYPHYQAKIPGQGNEDIDQLSKANVWEASIFHEKHHINTKGLKKKIL